MRTVTDIADLAALRGGVFVPTMGGLHEGHASLITQAAHEAAKLSAVAGSAAPVIVSVFVNPTQFDEQSDYERYPRTLDADAALAEKAGADILFAPARDAVYPPDGGVTPPPLPEVARLPRLEDRFRPGHFEGVCQVVRRLFNLVQPAAAIFGEKDWQQLQTVRAMVERDGPGVEILAGKTIRERDGLAMSSRNRFLSPDDRAKAAAIPQALCDANGEATPARAEQAMRNRLEGAGLEVQYATVRSARTLLPLDDPESPPPEGFEGRALIAVRVGQTRLIDNAPWPV